MSTARSIASMWQHRAAKSVVLIFVVLCLGVAGYAVQGSNGKASSVNNSRPEMTDSGKANAVPKNELLPVTVTQEQPTTSSINAPGNMSGQDLQSQPDATPNTASPQQTAPTPSPVQSSPPDTSITYPGAPHCAPCGGIDGDGGKYSPTVIACPMYCVK